MTLSNRPSFVNATVKLPCTVYRLRMAARRATRLYDHHLAPADIGIAQFGLLQTLSANSGATVTGLAAALDMDRTTMTRNLLPLIRLGLVKAGEGPDRRSRAVVITDAGIAKLKQALPYWRAAQTAVRDALGEAEVTQLHALLDTAVADLPET
jgi:DNA-binding MarR family transcriptional regulator